ncbi:hypothetical protein KJC03_12130 [Mammaliicoccus sciuri]|uniref:hypothetical protein n=1 Tax=Mammaliicoccus sciuri TaxID=1296 RepID=UPI001F192D5E|nr:hypothetical protein [Mammaliicoccus sciuri]MCE5041842.1 hypothetical protein [Mammaliicoccus sciuri]
MNRETTQSDWQKIVCYLESHDYVSIVKGLVSYFTEVGDEEILDKIYDDFMNDDSITTVLNNDLQTIINHYLLK